MIGIINIGNACSVQNALTKLGYDSKITCDKDALIACDALILPGVGEFGTVMNSIKPLVPVIKNWKKPFLGICAGMQVLFEMSEESPTKRGLGIFRGKVKRFQNIRTPQIGWNTLENVRGNLITAKGYAYFVNSYYCVPDKQSIVTSKTTYGITFASSVGKNNFLGVQFHPEKSGEYGLEILDRFGRSFIC